MNLRSMPSSGLRSLLPDGVVLQPVLGSATDPQLLQCLFAGQSVELVFHTAATNMFPWWRPIRCRVLPITWALPIRCAAPQSPAAWVSCSDLYRQSSRPTNVMGASKRLAELVVQAHAAEATSTCLSMVRFGNVLGSSGSVVPLFRRQIAAGGQITSLLEIIRYFMTISEAATLVLQSSVLKVECFLARYG